MLFGKSWKLSILFNLILIDEWIDDDCKINGIERLWKNITKILLHDSKLINLTPIITYVMLVPHQFIIL